MRRAFVASAGLTMAIAALGCRAEARDAGVGDTSGAKQPRATAAADCSALPNTADFKRFLHAAPDSGEAGGLFHGRAEWAAIVNRKGQICAVIPPSDSAGGYWPGP